VSLSRKKTIHLTMVIHSDLRFFDILKRLESKLEELCTSHEIRIIVMEMSMERDEYQP